MSLLQGLLEHLIVCNDELQIGFGDIQLDFKVCLSLVGFAEER